MKARTPSRISLFLLLAAWLALSACQVEDPPPAQTLLRVRLNDSLSRYERVLVQIFSQPDSTLLLTLWNAPLPSPSSDLPAYDLKALGTERFLVMVTAYRADHLMLQTRILYSAEGKYVFHDPVPPLVPENRLKAMQPSVGVLSPPFDRDSLRYLVKLPQDVHAISFNAAPLNARAIIQVNGQPLQSGMSTKTYQLGNQPDSVTFQVTDTTTGVATTQNYKVIVIPTPPLGLYLASLEPSTGFLGTLFIPENTVYNLYMPPDKDTVSFRADPLDRRTMTVTIDGQAVFPGTWSQVLTVEKLKTRTVDIYVRRGTEAGYYRITLDHTQTFSH